MEQLRRALKDIEDSKRLPVIDLGPNDAFTDLSSRIDFRTFWDASSRDTSAHVSNFARVRSTEVADVLLTSC